MFLSSNAKTPRFIGSAPVLCEYCGNFLLERNIVRIFANNDNGYDEKGLYGPGGTNCPLCQGDGASGADGYSAIPCQAGQLLFRGYSRSVADCQSDRIAASKGVERGRISSVTARTKIPAAGERLFLLILFVVRRITFNEKQIWRLKYWERGAPDARYSTKR